MALHLQIQTPETIRLVEELSRRTGESAESAVEIAVRERLERLLNEEAEVQRRAEVYTLVKQLNAHVREAGISSIDRGELIYDKDGFPRQGE